MRNNADKKCLIFDLDGTILDSMWVWEQIDIDFLGRRGIEVTPDYISEIKTHNFITGSRYVIDRYNLKESPEDIMKEWHDMAQHYYSEVIDLKENVKDFLIMAKESGCILTVATSSEEGLFKPCLKRNGVYDLFDSFTRTTEAARGKAFADVYELAAKKCGVLTQQCVVFEDILIAAKGAKSGGFYTVGVYDSLSADDEDAMRSICDRYIYNFNEMKGYLL